MNYELETVPCNFCGSDVYSIYIKDAKDLYNRLEGTFSVATCNRCGFKFTNPRPTIDTIVYFYPDTAGYYRPEKPKLSLMTKDRIGWSNYLPLLMPDITKYGFGYLRTKFDS